MITLNFSIMIIFIRSLEFYVRVLMIKLKKLIDMILIYFSVVLNNF